MHIIRSIKNYLTNIFQKKSNEDIIPDGNTNALMLILSEQRLHNVDRVKNLLAANANPNNVNISNNPAIVLAAQNTAGYAASFMHCLLNTEIPLDVNKPDNKKKSTPLMIAIQHENFQAAEILLAEGADICIKNTDKISAKILCKTNKHLPKPFVEKVAKFEKLHLTPKALNKQAYATGKLLSKIFPSEILDSIGQYAYYTHRRKYFNNMPGTLDKKSHKLKLSLAWLNLST